MQHLRKTGGFLMKNRLSLSSSLKSYNGLSSLVQHHPSSKCVSDMGFDQFSCTVMGKTGFNGLVKRGMMNLGSVSNYARGVGRPTKAIQEAGGLPMHLKEGWLRGNLMTCQTPFQLARSKGTNPNLPSSVRSFSSRASRSAAQNRSEARKDVSTVEDPFDAPTYNIPEKPVTFTEGASYTVIILGGIFIACGAIYGVLTELVFQPKEYKVFDKALDRVQNDSQVRVRIGSPIIGFGSESVNRAARQRIPNRKWKDEDGVEHIEINFFIRGPRGNGAVYAEMFKDKVDKQWKYTYLVVQIKAPVAAELMLESYVPA